MIKVTDKYYIDYGADCCTIYEEVFSEKKQEYILNSVCYPSSLVQAVQKIMGYSFEEITKECEMSLTEALSTLKELRKEYQDILDEIREMGELK